MFIIPMISLLPFLTACDVEPPQLERHTVSPNSAPEEPDSVPPEPEYSKQETDNDGDGFT